MNFVAKLFLMVVQNIISFIHANNVLKWDRAIMVEAIVAVKV